VGHRNLCRETTCNRHLKDFADRNGKFIRLEKLL
jgi:hypothetical protein